MKLERYKDKKETRKKIMLIGLTMVTLVSVSMALFKTFANFRQTVSFPIMSGKVIYKKKGLELGKDIKPSLDGSENGLFAVTPTGPSGWEKTEYRYAGPNPNNYVYFNCDNGQEENNTTCELWRIIGLVNAKTSSGAIEQRLKIVRSDSIGDYSWTYNVSTNDWNRSDLKNMLNDGYYYQKTGVTCYTGPKVGASAESTCNFNSSNPKGLTEKARNMIDNNVIWNIGGWDSSNVTAETIYEYERGTARYGSNKTEWSTATDSTGYRGVGLMYQSDYGYAVGGSIRSSCLKSTLTKYDSDSCSSKDWLYLGKDEWSLTQYTTNANLVFTVSIYRYASLYTGQALGVRPTIYLNSDIKLGEGEGTLQTPYHLVVG